MTHENNITGRTFNMLTAIKRLDTKGPSLKWEFKCACGNTTVTHKSSVVTGKIKSCGCELKRMRKTFAQRVSLNREERREAELLSVLIQELEE